MANVLQQLLLELDQVLAAERQSLEKLDRGGIELAAERKLALVERIAEVRQHAPVMEENRELLSKLRESTMTNHLLLAHARACVRGALALVGEQPIVEGPAVGRTSVRPPLAVSIRG